jgi:hypothetical protein
MFHVILVNKGFTEYYISKQSIEGIHRDSKDLPERVDVKNITEQKLHVNMRRSKGKLGEKNEPNFTVSSRFTHWIAEKDVMRWIKILKCLLDNIVDRFFETQ